MITVQPAENSFEMHQFSLKYGEQAVICTGMAAAGL